jgi:hypothetical protein
MVYGQCRDQILEFIHRLGTQRARNILEVGSVSIFRWSGSEPVKKELPSAENSSVRWTHKTVVSLHSPVISEDGRKRNSEIL